VVTIRFASFEFLLSVLFRLAPTGVQRGQQAAVDVRGVHAEVTAHLFKVNGANAR
jgi:hypothetical protein